MANNITVDNVNRHNILKLSVLFFAVIFACLNKSIIDQLDKVNADLLYEWGRISLTLFTPFAFLLFFLSRYFSVKKAQKNSVFIYILGLFAAYYFGIEKYNWYTLENFQMGCNMSIYLALIMMYAQIYNRIEKVLKFASVDKVLAQYFLIGFTLSSLIIYAFLGYTEAHLFIITLTASIILLFLWLRLLNSYTALKLVNQNILIIHAKHSFFKIISNRFYHLIVLKSMLLTSMKWMLLLLMFFQAMTHFKDKDAVLGFEVILFGVISLFVFIVRKLFTNQVLDKFGRLSIFYVPPLILILFSCTAISIHFLVDNQHEAFMGIPSLQMVVCTLLFVLFFTYLYSLEEETKDDVYQTISEELRSDFLLISTIVVSILSVTVCYGLYYAFGNLDEYKELLYFSLLSLVIAYMVVTYFLKKDYYKELEDAIGDKSFRHANLFPILNLLNKREIENINVRLLNLLRKIAPLTFDEKLPEFISHSEDTVQSFGVNEMWKEGKIGLLPNLQKIIKYKRFWQSQNAPQIHDVFLALTEIEERLENKNYIEQLSLSKLSTERVLGAKLSIELPEEKRSTVLKRLLQDPIMNVRRAAIISCGEGKVSDEVYAEMANNMSEIGLQNVVIDAVYKIGDHVTDMLHSTFNAVGQTVLTQERILQLYGLLNTKKSYAYLLKAVNHTNQKVYLAALDTLSVVEGSIDKNRHIIEKHIETLSKQIVWNYMAIVEIKKNNFDDKTLENALIEDCLDKLDAILRFCGILYDYQTFAIVKSVINSKTEDEINFGVQLLEVALPNILEVKPMIIIIFKKLSFEDKLKELDAHWPVDFEGLDDIINKLIYNDAQLTNRWSRISTLHLIPTLRTNIFKNTLITQLENDDHLIQQTAFIILSEWLHKDELTEVMYRLTYDNEELKELWNTYTMQNEVTNVMEILMGMKRSVSFQKLNGDIICDIMDISNVETLKRSERAKEFYFEEEIPYIYVHKGNLEIEITDKKGTRKRTIAAQEWFNPLDEFFIDLQQIKCTSNAVTQVVITPQDEFESLIGRKAKLYHFVESQQEEQFIS
ncbi:hypothetical protein MY04_4923 [Flammeovirga sp. MY04]|uniref:hypothetical protein n=1 Tax=Flammeovirga sp. MY04 TaxID=1191459 RepID=UPI000806210A|nr:hypothetical protein [Flammeovirga sp. MY04]ANQ52258.1 hypothetical protein MY04_4923 [Flammeovirga sp. MY04]